MNSRKTTILICLMAAPLLSAPAIEDDDTPRPPDKTELRSPVVTVPFDADASRPTIEAKINGMGPFRFILDTGAQGMLINSDLAKELNLKATGKSHMGDPSDPEAIEVDRVRLDTVSIGDVVLTGVNANSWERPAAFGHGLSDTRGIIGLMMLTDLLVTFDYANNEMRLTRGELPPVNGKDVIKFETDGEGLPTIKLHVGDVAFDAHIDSGSPGGFTLPENVQDRLKLKSKPTVVGHARTVNSSFDILAADLDGDVRIGSHTFEQPKLVFIDMLNSSGVGNIGSAILRQFNVTFDQRNGRIRFSDRRDAPTTIGAMGH
ncbi:MAG: aspartyl protease family protein [Planctomycetes bacterium]|nr:aspartyl protease family protein [Planctomycetota bacterium]